MVSTIRAHRFLYGFWISVIGLILLGVRFNTLFVVPAFLLSVFAFIFLPSNEAVVLCIGLFPYASLFKLDPDTLSLFTICEIMFIALLLLRRKKTDALLFSSILILFSYMLATSSSQLNILTVVKTILTLFLIAFLPSLLGKSEIKNIAYTT